MTRMLGLPLGMVLSVLIDWWFGRLVGGGLVTGCDQCTNLPGCYARPGLRAGSGFALDAGCGRPWHCLNLRPLPQDEDRCARRRRQSSFHDLHHLPPSRWRRIRPAISFMGSRCDERSPKPGAQVVEARLAVGRQNKPVLGTLAMTGEAHVALPAKRGGVSRLSRPNLICCGEATKLDHVRVPDVLPTDG